VRVPAHPEWMRTLLIISSDSIQEMAHGFRDNISIFGYHHGFFIVVDNQTAVTAHTMRHQDVVEGNKKINY
jgi:hypothetical protein